MQSEFLKIKVIPVVFGTEYCKEEGGLLLYCLVLVGEVNYHKRGILQFQQNHQAYFQGHLMLYQDMSNDFLAKDPQKWKNHKMNKNLDSSFQRILLGNAVCYVSSMIVHTTVLYSFAKLEKKEVVLCHIFEFEKDPFSLLEKMKIL